MQHLSAKQLLAPGRSRQALGIVAMIVALALLGGVLSGNSYLAGRDYLPLAWAAQLELSGKSAYGPAMAGNFQRVFEGQFGQGGFAYPLTAIWLGLPVALLPAPFDRALWCVLSLGSLLLGLRLNRMPYQLLLFVPVIWSVKELQVTLLLVGLLLIGQWAWQERRMWLLGAVVMLTLTAKPQTTLLLAGALALLMLRAGAWRPLLVWTLLLVVPTFLLEPAWPVAWLQAVASYQAHIQTMWLIGLLPLAALLAWRRKFWSAAAVAQICLFPMVTHAYTLLPLLCGYQELRDGRKAGLVALCSWLSLFLVPFMPNIALIALCYLLPLAFVGWQVRRFEGSQGSFASSHSSMAEEETALVQNQRP